MLLAIFGFLFSPTASFSSQNLQYSYGYLAKDERSVISSSITSIKILQDPTVKELHIVIMGAVVEGLPHNSELHVIMKKAHDAGVQFKICDMALTRFGWTGEDLPEFLDVIPNAHIYMFDIMRAGFLTLTI